MVIFILLPRSTGLMEPIDAFLDGIECLESRTASPCGLRSFSFDAWPLKESSASPDVVYFLIGKGTFV